jgi:hypothetical protein
MAGSGIVQDVTSVSTDAGKLLRTNFATEFRRTGTSTEDTVARNWTMRPRDSAILYDPFVIRFYEEIIASLQKELARYKALAEAAARSTVAEIEPEIIEPGQPVNLRAADRARMNRVMPGVYTPPEPL